MLKRIANNILSLLYPPKCIFCESPLHHNDSGLLVCSSCYDSLPFTDNHGCFAGMGDISYIISPFEYIHPVSDALIRMKFVRRRIYADTLAYFLADYLKHISEIGYIDAVIPVPLSDERRRFRDFNQAELLATAVAKALSLPLDKETLIRTHNTKAQSYLSQADRAINVHDAFGCVQAVENMRILLIDDISTTGATARNCAKALKAAGAGKIILATVATTVKNYAHEENRRIIPINWT